MTVRLSNALLNHICLAVPPPFASDLIQEAQAGKVRGCGATLQRECKRLSKRFPPKPEELAKDWIWRVVDATG